MKCDKYMQLIEDLTNQELSAKEAESLKHHLENCEKCRQEYLAIEKYKSITLNLKINEPVLSDRESFIDDILRKLPEKKSINNRHLTLVPYPVRLVLTSMAASLVLFFSIQQLMDAWQIKQLETRSSEKKVTVDYNIVKAGILFDFFENHKNRNYPVFLSNVKKNMINELLNNLKYRSSVLTENHITKLPGPDFVFRADSNNHH